MATGPNTIQSPHVNDRLAKLYGVKGSAIAPELNPSIQPVVIVDNADTEDDPWTTSVRSCIGTITSVLGDGVTTFPQVGFFLPIQTTDLLVRIKRICLQAGQNTPVNMYFASGTTLINTEGGNKAFNDRSIGGQPQLNLRFSSVAGGAIANPVACFRCGGGSGAVSNDPFELPIILRDVGQTLGPAVVFQPVNGATIVLTAWWTEEPSRR